MNKKQQNDNSSDEESTDFAEHLESPLGTLVCDPFSTRGEGEETDEGSDQGDRSSTDTSQTSDQPDVVSEASWSSFENQQGLVSSKKLTQNLLKPIFQENDIKTKLSCLKELQDWFQEVQKIRQRLAEVTQGLDSSVNNYIQKFLRMEKFYSSYEPAASELVMKELEESKKRHKPSNDNSAAAKANQTSSFSIVRPPKVAGFDIDNNTSLSSTGQSPPLTTTSTMRRYKTASEEELTKCIEKLTKKLDSMSESIKNASPRLGVTFDQRDVAPSQNAVTTSPEPRHSTPKDKPKKSKPKDASNEDLKRILQSLKKERQELEDELERQVKSPFFNPSDSGIVRRDQRIVEIIEEIDRIGTLTQTFPLLTTRRPSSMETVSELIAERIRELEQEDQCLEQELALRPELLKSDPDNHCLRRRFSRRKEIREELQRLQKNLESIRSCSKVAVPTVPKSISGQTKKAETTTQRLIKNDVSTHKVIRKKRGPTPTAKSETERQQFEQLSRFAEMVVKLEQKIKNLEEERDRMKIALENVVKSSPIEEIISDNFQRKSKTLKRLNKDVKTSISELKEIRGRFERSQRRQTDLVTQAKSSKVTTQSDSGRKSFRIVKDVETGEEARIENDTFHQGTRKNVGKGHDPPSDPSDSDGSSSDDDSPRKGRQGGDRGGRNGKSPDKTRSQKSSDSTRLQTTNHTRTVTGKKPFIKNFGGDDKSEALWIRLFLNATNTMGWNDEDRANNLPTYLTGPAEEWYKNHFGFGRRCSAEELLKPQVISWDTIIRAFHARFLGKGAAAKYIDAYNNFGPEKDENWYSMCQRYRSIAEMAYPQLSEEDKIMNLASKFGSKDRSIGLKIIECKSLSELEELCKSLDIIMAAKPNEETQSDTRKATSRGDNKSSRTWNDNRRSDSGQFKRILKRTGTTPAPKTTTNTNNDGSKSGEEEKKRSPYNVRCLNCWQIGHYYRDCERFTGKPKNPVTIENNYKKMYDKLNNRDPKSASIVETYLPYDDFHEAQRIAYQLDDDYIDITEDEDSKGSHAH